MLAVEWPLTRAPLRMGADFPPDTVVLFPTLQDTKQRVPTVIKRAGGRAWNHAVGGGYRRQGIICSRAYFKLKEIFRSCGFTPPGVSVHLCEGPGGFVQATEEFVGGKEWEWWAVSLPPETGPAFASDVLPLAKGRIVLEDIFCLEEAAVLPVGTADLVTADGAREEDHNRLEDSHFDLLVMQTRVAVQCLRPGGDYVCKFFEGAKLCTRQWIAVCTTLFDQVSIIKPYSSRPTNSERYLVCRSRTRQPVGESLLNVRRVVLQTDWGNDLGQILSRLASEQERCLKETFMRLNQS